jgi:Fur family zinc uptake transcriptional regulator
MTPKTVFTNTVPEYLTAAENLCMQRGVRLTNLRRAILEILLTVDNPVKAYDIIEYMRNKGQRITPATIYRTLEFFLQHGLIHRVNALNAYVPCTGNHEEHGFLMFVCSECRETTEIDDHVLHDSIRSRLDELGISLHDSCIEIQGTCRKCMQ